MIRLVVNGAAGRMGRRIVALGAEEDGLTLAAAFERHDHPDLGKDAGTLAGVEPLGVALSTRREVAGDVAIDFSHADSALEMTDWCAAHGVAERPAAPCTLGAAQRLAGSLPTARRSPRLQPSQLCSSCASKVAPLQQRCA